MENLEVEIVLFGEFVCAGHSAEPVGESTVHPFSIGHEYECLAILAIFVIFADFVNLATGVAIFVPLVQMP